MNEPSNARSAIASLGAQCRVEHSDVHGEDVVDLVGAPTGFGCCVGRKIWLT